MVLPLFFIYYFLPLSESATSTETNDRTDQKYQSAYGTFHLSALEFFQSHAALV